MVYLCERWWCAAVTLSNLSFSQTGLVKVVLRYELNLRKTETKIVFIFGMAAMPLICRDVGFSSYHRKVSLAVNLQMFLFSLCQKTNFHLYKWARLPLLFFTFCQQFFNDLYMCHNML